MRKTVLIFRSVSNRIPFTPYGVEKYQNKPWQVRLPFLLSLAMAGGVLIGATIFGTTNPKDKVTPNFLKFREILTYIQRDYVDTVNVDQLTDYAIAQMLENLDPHSVYIPPKEVELAKAPLEGDFDGIGVEFMILRDTIEVVTPISGGPSEAVGVRPGDKIVEVDDQKVAGIGITNRDVFKKLRGPKGTKVKILVRRRGENKPVTFTITRDKIPTHSVDVSYMIDELTGYIKVSRFSATTYDEFSQALSKLRQKNVKRLILDLRDNPGGYMDRATRMADDFLDGNRLIVYTQAKDGRFNQRYTSAAGGAFVEGDVIVLVNEGSASASEIVSGALQDNDRALIVGRRSFGKGLVQMPINLTDGSELRLTISRYYTPAGRSIQKSYAKGSREYENDWENRYKRGEFFHADSIKFADSLKYKTTSGRIVYGGGGIMPDVFVPLDTNEGYRYMNALANKNLLREYSLDYANKYRSTLEKMTVEQYIKTFQIADADMQALIKLGEQNGIAFNEKHYRKTEKNLRNLLKAFVARNIWREEGFFPVYHQEDEVLQRAMGLWAMAGNLKNTGTKSTTPASGGKKAAPAKDKKSKAN